MNEMRSDRRGGELRPTYKLVLVSQIVVQFDRAAERRSLVGFRAIAQAQWRLLAFVREVAAERIVELASKGERDPDKLCRDALALSMLEPRSPH